MMDDDTPTHGDAWTEIVKICTDRLHDVDRDELRRTLITGIDAPHRAQAQHILQVLFSPKALQVWLAISGAAARRNASGGLYQNLLTRCLTEKPRLADDIDRDIPRAFPTNPEFNTAENLEKLRKALYAFCLWHPSVYYCQSLCFIAGFLLLNNHDDEATFYILQQMHTSQMREYFTQPMLGWQIDQKCLEVWLGSHNSSVVNHIKSNRLTIPMITSQWVLCGFINTLPMATVQRIWDIFLLDGAPFLLAAVSAFLDHLSSDILYAGDAGSIFKVFRPERHTGLDVDCFLNDAVAIYLTRSHEILDLRREMRPVVETEVKEIHKRHFKTELTLVTVPPDDRAKLQPSPSAAGSPDVESNSKRSPPPALWVKRNLLASFDEKVPSSPPPSPMVDREGVDVEAGVQSSGLPLPRRRAKAEDKDTGTEEKKKPLLNRLRNMPGVRNIAEIRWTPSSVRWMLLIGLSLMLLVVMWRLQLFGEAVSTAGGADSRNTMPHAMPPPSKK